MQSNILVFLILFCFYPHSWGGITNRDLFDYLENYGYLESFGVRSVNEEEDAIKEFQEIAGLEPTGELDARTKAS